LSRPRITLKLASSLDGKIALANGQSEWITGEKARAEGRRLRASHEAIAVGANTAVLDNPQLTTRLSGEPDPIRVIFDSHLRLSSQSNLALTAHETPVWVFCRSDEGSEANALKDIGIRLLPVPYKGGLNIDVALDVLKSMGVSSLLLEGGGALAASFLKANVIDRIEWFRASLILGGDGRNGIGDLNLTDLTLARRFSRIEIRDLGDDIHERYERIS